MDNKRVMSDRIRKLYEIVRTPKIAFSVEKARLFTEAFQKYEGDPNVIRMAKAQAYMLENIPIYIMEGDLLAGAPASRPMCVEADFWTKGTWQKEGIESLRGEEYSITDEQAELMYQLTEYWHKIIPEYKLYDLYDEPMWAWKKSGYLLPVNKTLEEAAGMGYACNGMAILPEADTYQIDYEYVLKKGLQATIDEAREKLKQVSSMEIKTEEDIEKIYVWKAMIIINEGVIHWANRYADLAEAEAEKCQDANRKNELLQMAEICRRVPRYPAETFREAMQFLWFLFLMISCQTTTPLGRLDQVLYPYYQKDQENGVLDDETVLEYLENYRLKIMQMKNTSGGQSRLKWSGQARWNGVTLGGVDENGKDVTNAMTYLFLEAAYRCRTPHHTLHLRVHEGTPEELLMKAVELVSTGIGMPSFNSDRGYITTLMEKGVPLKKARNYMVMGCVDPTVPEGWGHVYSMMVTSLPFDTFLHNGYSPYLGMQIGPKTGDVCQMKTYEEFEDKMLEHQRYYIEYFAQDMLLRYLTGRKEMQDPFPISLFSDGVEVGVIGKMRKLPYGLGPTLNLGVGTINVGDSMAVIKKLVFDEKKITMKQLVDALDANWEGEENQKIRQMCLDVPKYGNDNEETDAVVSRVYNRLIDIGCSVDSYRGGKFCVSGLSITAHDPGGRLTGATPDGRYAGSPLADGSVSPEQGCDVCGPTAMLNSAMRLPQTRLNATLHNMKIHPTALKSEDDKRKLIMLIRTYMMEGGNQIQFNVVDQDTLIHAQEEPEKYKDLIVRVAGYSTYFVSLSKNVQDEVIERTSYRGL
ncbi:pyruvate formate lyase family protein [Hominifimenecus sp. rT4P-3]|uniref:pyruvate formate lyase family protein n=1 Tax=Hominifimenecus sp. rT4P-3 TaxID=3242979 RepID=UPI003DA5D6D9